MLAMNRLSSTLLQLCLIATFASEDAAFAKSPTFPGRGSRQAWNIALRIYGQGVDASESGRLDQAIANYSKAIAIYPYCAAFYHNLAIDLGDKGQFVKAERNAKKAVELSPREFDFQWQYAKTLLDQRKYLAAREVLANMRRQPFTSQQIASVEDVIKQIDSKLKKSE